MKPLAAQLYQTVERHQGMKSRGGRPVKLTDSGRTRVQTFKLRQGAHVRPREEGNSLVESCASKARNGWKRTDLMDIRC